MTPEAYRAIGIPGADDLGNMFQFKRDFENYFCGARDPAFARKLYPGLQNFATWLARNKSRIPLESAGARRRAQFRPISIRPNHRGSFGSAIAHLKII